MLVVGGVHVRTAVPDPAVHVRVYEEVTLTFEMVSVPLSALVPLHAPDATQVAAPVDDHVWVTARGPTPVAGVVVNVTV